MTPERWKHVERLFEQALETPVADREAWLRTACGDDQDLLREVRSLLAHDDPLAEPLHASVRDAIVSLPSAQAPRRVGPYELLDELGHGGMGTVYKARRRDGAYDALVAVKIVRPGMDTDFVLTRFRQERQTLAKLNHPNIARLVDGGVTAADGVQYIVTEYVDGERITDYVRRTGLDVDDMLRLMLPVCLATDHAHRNFVVHRDIKPGNILVDRAGTPKLLDFGICKLLHTNAVDAQQTMTQGMGPMTPDYASPEQVLGESISVRSDVYSLGAVLYELLAGVRPHKFESATLAGIERAICETPVTPPSQVPGHGRARRLRGDIDNIVMRALEKDPRRRYESAAALAEDVRRYLEQEPVAARPTSGWYKARKFLRRHRVLAGTTAAALVTTTTGAVLAARQAQRAEAREQQVRSFARVFLYDVHDKVRDLPGATDARQTIVRTAVDYLNALAGSAPSDPALLRELAAGYQRIADLEGSDARGANLGDSQGALANYAKAVEFWDRLLERQWERTGAVERLNALRRQADIVSQVPGSQQAFAVYDRVEVEARALATRFPDDDGLLQLLGDVLTVSARRYRFERQLPQSLTKAREALEILRRLSTLAPDDGERTAAVASAESALGMTLARQGDLGEALDLYRRSVERNEALVDAQPQNLSRRRNLMIAYSHVGDVLGYPELPNLSDTTGADAAYSRMIDVAREIAASDPRDARAATDLAIAMSRWALVAPTPELSAQRLRESLALFQARRRQAPDNLTLLGYEVVVSDHLSKTARAAGDPQVALAHSRHAVDVGAQRLEQGNDFVVRSFVNAARRLMRHGTGADAARVTPAQAAFLTGFAERAATKASDEDDVAAHALQLQVYALQAARASLRGEKTEAIAWHQKALAGWRAVADRPAFRPYAQELRELEAWQP